jgi:hypothetical protein
MILHSFLKCGTLLLFVIVFINSAYAQHAENCQVLSAILNDDMSRRTFKFDKNKELPIVFIDIKGLFKGCEFSKAYDRNVKIIEDTTHMHEDNASYIVLFNLKKERKKCKLEIYQKHTGAYGHIEFRKKKQDYILSKFDVGYF